ncbi:hemagglutinin, partial [Burkholderia cenocepacia]|nr:hemagglutinin [Burkholderia cenocepacia]
NVSVKTLSNRVDGVDARVTNNETAVTNIRNELGSGEVGLVRQDPDTNAITVAADHAGASANFAGTEGARKLRGVAEGELSSASNDAVNGKQLNATNVDVKNLSTRVNGIDARVTNNETAITNIRSELGSG